MTHERQGRRAIAAAAPPGPQTQPVPPSPLEGSADEGPVAAEATNPACESAVRPTSEVRAAIAVRAPDGNRARPRLALPRGPAGPTPRRPPAATRPRMVTPPAVGTDTTSVDEASGRDRGSSTVELAVSLPALVLMLFVALTAVVAVQVQGRCVDAAREAARAEARGEPGVPAGQRAAPPGATVRVDNDGEIATATVRVRIRPLGGTLPSFEVAATAVAAVEPGVG